MPVLKLFVDTGMKGGAVALRDGNPTSHFSFKKDKLGRGIKVEQFVQYCRSLVKKEGIWIFVEDPAKVQRSLRTTAPQYIVVGQILAILKIELKREPLMISANQWINFVKRSLDRPDLKDPKDRSRLFAQIHFKKYLNHHFPDKPAPDGITDCLGMAAYMNDLEAKTWLQI